MIASHLDTSNGRLNLSGMAALRTIELLSEEITRLMEKLTFSEIERERNLKAFNAMNDEKQRREQVIHDAQRAAEKITEERRKEFERVQLDIASVERKPKLAEMRRKNDAKERRKRR